MSLALVVLVGVLFAGGTYLVLQRSMTRIIVGVGLLANGANFLLLSSGSRQGNAPIVGIEGPQTDPVPQAFILTAIVIGFALTAFMVALAWRILGIDGNDVVEDDIEDRRQERITSVADSTTDHPTHEDVAE